MSIIDDSRREFIAKAVLNIGTAIFTVGLASYFFEKFPIALRIGLGITSVVFIVGSFFIHPRGKDGKK